MMRRIPTVLLLAVACGAGAAPALEGLRPVEPLWPPEPEAAIEWAADWKTTLKINRERWTRELARTVRDSYERRWRLRLRMARLYEALLAKAGDDAGRRAEALLGIGTCYQEAHMQGRANYWFRRAIDESPGHVDLAAGVCHRILEKSAHAYAGRTNESAAWVEYAADRLLALERAGVLSEGHPRVVAAWQARAVQRRHEGRLLEAADALARVEAATGRTAWVDEERAELMFLAGQAVPEAPEPEGEDEEEAVDAVPPSAPTFPTQHGLEVRWAAALAGPVADLPGCADLLIAEDAEARWLVPWGSGRHTSLWSAIDRTLAAQDAATRAAMRALQERVARRGGASVLARFRRAPWAAAVHRALLADAEAALRRGQTGLAFRSFADVARHSADPALRLRAQLGAALALTGESGHHKPPFAPFDGVPDDTDVPWMGGSRPARLVRERLARAAAGAPAPGPAPADLRQRRLPMPPALAWPAELFRHPAAHGLGAFFDGQPSVQADAGGFLVAGPARLVRFGTDGRELWRRASTRPRMRRRHIFGRDDGRYVTVPGTFRPLVSAGRLICRWGLDAEARCLTSLAAFDLATGAMAWSTADDPAWRELVPAAEPVLADGRLYALAIRPHRWAALPVAPMHLVCLDAATGRLLWARLLASHDLALPGTGRYGSRESPLDLAHYGSPPTVNAGTVFCQTHVGFVARCDARDGAIEWVRSYRRERPAGQAARFIARRGAAPILWRDRVVFLPRDRMGCFALDRHTGSPLWDNPFAPSDQSLGTVDGLLLVADRHTLAALDLATGAARWSRHVPEGMAARPRRVGTTVYLPTPGALVGIAAATGHTTGSAPWRDGTPPSAFALRNGEIAIPSTAPEPSPPLPQPSQPLRLPVAECWRLDRANPRLAVPPPEAHAPDRLLVFSDGRLECLAAGKGLAWQRPHAECHRALAWAPGLLLIIDRTRVTAIDLATGARRWQLASSLYLRQWQVVPGKLVVGESDARRYSRRLRAIDLASGTVSWTREFRELGGGHPDPEWGIGWDGTRLHLPGRTIFSGSAMLDLVVRPEDGAVAALHTTPFGRPRRPVCTTLGAGLAACVDDQRRVTSFALGSEPAARTHKVNLTGELRYARLHGFHIAPPWLLLRYYDSRRHGPALTALSRDDEAYAARRPVQGRLVDGQLHEIHPDGLVVFDLASRKEALRCTVEPPPGQRAWGLDHRQIGDALLLVSGHGTYHKSYGSDPRGIQLDAFDPRTGRHLRTQRLGPMPYWRRTRPSYGYERVIEQSQAAWLGNLLLLTDAGGVHAFATAPRPAPATPADLTLVHRAASPVEPDGDLGDWDDRPTLPLAGPAGARAGLRLAHDGRRLLVALACPAPELRPRHGRGHWGGGHWLELHLAQGHGTRRWGVGIGPTGRIAWETLDGHPLPPDLRAGIRHSDGRLTWELAVPVDGTVGTRTGRRIRVAATAWLDLPRRGQTPAAAWGLPDGRPVLLDPLTPQGEAAARTIAAELRGLPEAHALAEAIAQRRGQPTPPAPEAPAPEPSRVVAVLKAHIPHLGPSERCWQLFDALIRNAQPSHREEAGLLAWFLRLYPDHPRTVELLGRLLDRHKSLDPERGAERVEALLGSARVPPVFRYAYHRRYHPVGAAAICDWLVVGPFPTNGPVPALEAEPVALAKSYPTPRGPVRWTPARADGRTVDLERAVGFHEYAAAYAVCWLHAPKTTRAVLEARADDYCSVWLDRKPVFTQRRSRSRRDHAERSVPILLRRGWHELLVRVANRERRWDFLVELFDREGRGLLGAVTPSVSPPRE